MKKLFFLLAVISLFTSAAFAQAPNTKPTPYTLFGNMINLSNAKNNAYKDTVVSATVYQTTGYYNATTTGGTIYPVTGYGPITFTMGVVRASTIATTSPVSTSTLQSSSDNVTWGAVAGVSVQTVTATSATVPVVAKVTILGNYDLYYRWKHVVTVDSVALTSSYFLQKLLSTNIAK